MELTYWSTGEKRYAIYDRFRVEGEKSKYRLHVSGFSGNTDHDYWNYHDNMKFSTRDNDDRLCARAAKGGHWYNNCYRVHPTGLYRSVSHAMDLYHVGLPYIILKQMSLKIKAN